MMISLGSNDPGIFSNNLRTEFYQLYSILRDQFKLTDTEAVKKLHEVNERGQIYRFHSRKVKFGSNIHNLFPR